jgi:hypothetical protein
VGANPGRFGPAFCRAVAHVHSRVPRLPAAAACEVAAAR